MKTQVIYEDEDVIVALKPAGLATQTARTGQADMVSELKNYLAAGTPRKQPPYLGVVHRLDQPVEGLLVFAKNKQAAAALSAQLAKGTLHKQYLAVLCGNPSQKEGRLVDYLYKDERNTALVVSEGDAHFGEAKRAVLKYRIMKTIVQEADGAGKELSLAQIRIETGRFHQIRAQMAHAGMPLLGDVKYGGDKVQELSGRPGSGSTALCACRLTFLQPVSGKELSFKTKPQGKIFSLFRPQDFD